MKFIILLIALLKITQLNAFTVKLKEKKILSPVREHPVDEILYLTEMEIDGDQSKIDTVFDITTSSSWLIDRTCLNCKDNGINVDSSANTYFNKTGTSDEQFYIYGGQVLFRKNELGLAYEKGYMDVSLPIVSGENQDLKKTKFISPYEIAAPQSPQDIEEETCNQCSKTVLLTNSQAGIGLGPSEEGQYPFFKDLSKKVKLAENSAYFYINQNEMYVQFGSSQDYFKTGEWSVNKNTRHTNNNEKYNIQTSYTLRCMKVALNDTDTVPMDTIDPDTRVADKQFAVFTTTSKYIYFGHQSQVQKIVDGINKISNADCTQSFPRLVYICQNQVDISKFPHLTWYFQDNEGKESSMVLPPEAYVEKIDYAGVDKLTLLLRPGKFELQQSYVYDIALPNIWLGYPFFKQYYIGVNYDDDTIHFAERYQIPNEDKNLDNTFFMAILGIGGLLTVGLIAYLISLLKPLPVGTWVDYKPDQVKNILVLQKILPTRVFIPDPQNKEKQIQYDFAASPFKYTTKEYYDAAVQRYRTDTSFNQIRDSQDALNSRVYGANMNDISTFNTMGNNPQQSMQFQRSQQFQTPMRANMNDQSQLNTSALGISVINQQQKA